MIASFGRSWCVVTRSNQIDPRTVWIRKRVKETIKLFPILNYQHILKYQYSYWISETVLSRKGSLKTYDRSDLRKGLFNIRPRWHFYPVERSLTYETSNSTLLEASVGGISVSNDELSCPITNGVDVPCGSRVASKMKREILPPTIEMTMKPEIVVSIIHERRCL